MMDIAVWVTGQVESGFGLFQNGAEAVAPEDEGKENEQDQEVKQVDVTKMSLALEKQEDEKPESKWIRFLKSMDGYGESDDKYDPVGYPKTASGGCMFLLFRIIFALLIAWSIYNIASLETTVIPGDTMVFNVNQNSKAVGAKSSPVMDIPTLDFKIQNKLTFYEKEYPSIQSIEVIDLTGYNPRYISDLNEIPIARAMYEKRTLDLNSWDEATQIIKSPEDPIVSDLDSATVDAATHSFAESLKIFYKEGRVFGEVEEFYNHTTYLFVRFSASQLADIKMCQLQMSLYNKGVFEVLKETEALDERVYHTQELFPTLETHPATWQPKYFTIDRQRDEWSFKNPGRNLFILSSRFDEAELKRFVNSESWGPMNVNVTAVADLQFFYDEGGIHADDFLNWEYSISYVNNMKKTVEALSCDGGKRFDATFQKAFPISDAQNFVLLNTTIIPDFKKQLPFEVMISTAVDEEQMFVTSIGIDATTGLVKLTVDRSENEEIKDLRWYGDPFECNLDTFSQFAPDDWTCDPTLYWNKDGCHCDCGAYDPDCCLQLSSDTFNCRFGETCSLKGFCVNAKVDDTNVAWVSEGCENLYFAGETLLVGYVGSENAFIAESEGICQPCVDDLFYDGNAQLTFESTFVCEIETTGYISGQLNFLADVQLGEPYLDLVVYAETTPFPEKNFPYLVKVADTFGLEEELFVLDAHTVRPDYQVIRLTNSLNQRPTQHLVSYGRLFSACTSDSTTIVIQKNPTDPSFYEHTFSEDGPYSVRIADREVIISDASEVNYGTYQVLRLEAKVKFEFGFITQLIRPAKRGDTVIYVEPFEWWYDAKMKGLEYPENFPITVRGASDSYYGIELVYANGYLAPNWTCDPQYYNSDDGCHCQCGLLDPDCLYPSPNGYSGQTYDSSLACALDETQCVDCPFCEYPASTGNPQCTSTKPLETNLISPNISDNVQVIYLSTPLRYDHEIGHKVETPIPLPNDPKDGFEDFNATSSSIYDVYSWLPIRRIADTTEYKPSERYLAHTPELTDSPDPLEVEIAMFMIPDRNSFETVNLCAANNKVEDEIKPIFDTNGWDTWKVNDVINIRDCAMEHFDSESCVAVSDLPKDQFNVQCVDKMPPTHIFQYTTRIPVNNKWIWDSSASTLLNLPEFLIDVNHVYRFGYSNEVNEVEDEFATGAAPGGDTDSEGNIHFFFGEISNRGLGIGDNYTAANVPYLSNVISFVLSDTAVDDIIKYQPVGYPSTRKEVKKLLEKEIPDMVVEFDFDQLGGSTEAQYTPLEPGYAYFLSAEVAFEPVYKRGLLGTFVDAQIKGWNYNVITTSVQRVELDWFSRQQAEVRYTIKISPESTQVVQAYITDFKTFIDSLGSAAGIVGAGVFLLSIWHYLTCEVRRQRAKKEREERQKVVKAIMTTALVENTESERIKAKGAHESMQKAEVIQQPETAPNPNTEIDVEQGTNHQLIVDKDAVIELNTN